MLNMSDKKNGSEKSEKRGIRRIIEREVLKQHSERHKNE